MCVANANSKDGIRTFKAIQSKGLEDNKRDLSSANSKFCMDRHKAEEVSLRLVCLLFPIAYDYANFNSLTALRSPTAPLQFWTDWLMIFFTRHFAWFPRRLYALPNFVLREFKISQFCMDRHRVGQDQICFIAHLLNLDFAAILRQMCWVFHRSTLGRTRPDLCFF